MCLFELHTETARIHRHWDTAGGKGVDLLGKAPGRESGGGRLCERLPAADSFEGLRFAKCNFTITSEVVTAVLPEEGGEVVDRGNVLARRQGNAIGFVFCKSLCSLQN